MTELDEHATSPRIPQCYTPSSRILNNPNDEFESALTRSLSRPPSYIQTNSSDTNLLDNQRHLAILTELGQYYDEQDRNTQYMNRLLFFKDSSSSSSTISYKEAIHSCFMGQFKGLAMVFWIIVFIFLGAISVFVPSLPPGSQVLWLPLVIYLITAFILFRYRYKRSIRIDQLERLVLEERTRRRRRRAMAADEQQQQRELPAGYFFEIKYSPENAHPYRTLLKPPPIYTTTT
jgi:hypothetical protein